MTHNSKAKEPAWNLTEKWGIFGFVGGHTNNSEMKRNKTPVRQGKIYTS